jgi:hypothetical protein
MLVYNSPYIGTLLFVNFLSSFNNTKVIISKYSKTQDANNYNILDRNSVILNPNSPMKNQFSEIDVTWMINIEDRQVQPLNLTLVMDNFTYDWSYEFVEALPHSLGENPSGSGLFPFSYTISKTYKSITPQTIKCYSSQTLNSNVFITVSQISKNVSQMPRSAQLHMNP